jgi:hypothetical protein
MCEIKAGLGGDGTGIGTAAGAGCGAIFAMREEKLFCAAWMDDRAVCEIDCDRSCGRLSECPGGAKVGVLAVVNASVVVDVLGRVVKETSTSSFPSHRCIVGL